tara:strand:+ start:3223 stop:3708 length:486 start_codon:yes stop_codon:yes gene_type:complete
MVRNINKDISNQAIKVSALNLLAYRSRSKAELILKLRNKKYKLDDIKDVINELELKGYINDEEFTKMYASSLIKNKLFSRNAIKYKLQKHNISNEILGPILNNLFSKTDEKELIRKLITKKLRLKTKINENEIAKLTIYLKRKGFNWNDIKIVLSELKLSF